MYKLNNTTTRDLAVSHALIHSTLSTTPPQSLYQPPSHSHSNIFTYLPTSYTSHHTSHHTPPTPQHTADKTSYPSHCYSHFPFPYYFHFPSLCQKTADSAHPHQISHSGSAQRTGDSLHCPSSPAPFPVPCPTNSPSCLACAARHATCLAHRRRPSLRARWL
jgi:hypothetical protein